MTIPPVIHPIALPALPGAPDIASSSASTFADALGAAVSQVETEQSSASNAVSDLLIGGKGDVHNVALASQRASLSLELFQQVRNKFVSAYQEIMKMPM
ncbi:MAG: flagellar hook-basal body complex protein FliE [Bryobacteraceae bacterium]|jgi:flagellar hook-basal body complex protein FliE